MQFDAKISGGWATVPAKQWAKLVDVAVAAEKCSQTIKEDDWPEMIALNKALAKMSICDEAPDCETDLAEDAQKEIDRENFAAIKRDQGLRR